MAAAGRGEGGDGAARPGEIGLADSKTPAILLFPGVGRGPGKIGRSLCVTWTRGVGGGGWGVWGGLGLWRGMGKFLWRGHGGWWERRAGARSWKKADVYLVSVDNLGWKGQVM